MHSPPQILHPAPRFSFRRTDDDDTSENEALLKNFTSSNARLGSDRSTSITVYQLFLEPSNRHDESEKDVKEVIDIENAGQCLKDLYRIKIMQSTESDCLDISDIDLEMEIFLSKRLLMIQFDGGHRQLEEFVSHPDFPFFELAQQFISSPAERAHPLSNGVFVEASFQLDHEPEQLAMLVRVPYLAYREGENLDPTESWSLAGYHNRATEHNGHDIESGKKQILVHQGWLLLLNSGAILATKSRDDGNLSPMVFPGQDRLGGFHVFVHMIGDLMRCSEGNLVEELSTAAKQNELELLTSGDAIDGRDPKRLQITTKQLFFRINAVANLVEDQIRILNTLQELFERAAPDRMSSELQSNHYSTNVVTIPVLSGEIRSTGEQLTYVVAIIRRLMGERRVLFDKLSHMLLAQKQVLNFKEQATLVRKQITLAEETRAETRVQLELSRRADEQGKGILVFTIITTIFLPLSFFTSYFGMNTIDMRNTVVNQTDFWKYCGPISAIVVLIALVVAFRNSLLRRLKLVNNHSHWTVDGRHDTVDEELGQLRERVKTGLKEE